MEGEHPPRGARFTESLWEMLELCWAPQPDNRPSIEAVLQCLEMVSSLSAPPSPGVDEGINEGGGDWNAATSSSGGDSLDFFDTDDRVQLPTSDSLWDHHLTSKAEDKDYATKPYNSYNLSPVSVIAVEVGSEPSSLRSLSRALDPDDSDYPAIHDYEASLPLNSIRDAAYWQESFKALIAAAAAEGSVPPPPSPVKGRDTAEVEEDVEGVLGNQRRKWPDDDR